MFINALAVSAVLLYVISLVIVIYVNKRAMFDVYSIPVQVTIAGFVGALWLLFG